MAATNGSVLDTAAATAMVKLLRDFVTKIELVAEEETKSWAEQFRARIEAFDSNSALKVPTSGKKPEEGHAEGQVLITSGDEHRMAIRDGTLAGAAVAAAAGGAGRPAALPPSSSSLPTSVVMRAAIVAAQPIDPGSLTLRVNDAAVDLPEDGRVELPLSIGVSHRIVPRPVAQVASRSGRSGW